MNDTPDPQILWSESTSHLFLNMAEIFVPARTEQITTLVQLLPAGDEGGVVVELGAGGGALAEAILEEYPHCRYLALDGSQVMRTHLEQRLARFAERLEVRPFVLEETTWREELPEQVCCVLSSLCVHHLDDGGKRQLFHDMYAHLQPGGALLLADLVLPANQRVANFLANQYETLVREQSLALRGDLSGFAEFQRQEWNYYRYDYGKPALHDHPSLLSDQLRWLQEARFSTVDCYWMRAGHAIYGGYK